MAITYFFIGRIYYGHLIIRRRRREQAENDIGEEERGEGNVAEVENQGYLFFNIYIYSECPEIHTSLDCRQFILFHWRFRFQTLSEIKTKYSNFRHFFVSSILPEYKYIQYRKKGFNANS